MNRLFRTITACALGAFLITSLPGCRESYDGPERAKVGGKASFDGTAIANGSITLVPDGHEGRTVSVPIFEGVYLVEETDGPNLGKYKVEIYGFEGGVAGEDEESGIRSEFARSQIIPAKYNTETELDLVISEADMQKDWDLTP